MTLYLGMHVQGNFCVFEYNYSYIEKYQIIAKLICKFIEHTMAKYAQWTGNVYNSWQAVINIAYMVAQTI